MIQHICNFENFAKDYNGHKTSIGSTEYHVH
nr:MAG TPA: hypothetical protein [Caudoviricetes sp.]